MTLLNSQVSYTVQKCSQLCKTTVFSDIPKFAQSFANLSVKNPKVRLTAWLEKRKTYLPLIGSSHYHFQEQSGYRVACVFRDDFSEKFFTLISIMNHCVIAI